MKSGSRWVYGIISGGSASLFAILRHMWHGADTVIGLLFLAFFAWLGLVLYVRDRRERNRGTAQADSES
jgi:hypothetical protein